jgi:hypothetical protein
MQRVTDSRFAASGISSLRNSIASGLMRILCLFILFLVLLILSLQGRLRWIAEQHDVGLVIAQHLNQLNDEQIYRILWWSLEVQLLIRQGVHCK